MMYPTNKQTYPQPVAWETFGTLFRGDQQIRNPGRASRPSSSSGFPQPNIKKICGWSWINFINKRQWTCWSWLISEPQLDQWDEVELVPSRIPNCQIRNVNHVNQKHGIPSPISRTSPKKHMDHMRSPRACLQHPHPKAIGFTPGLQGLRGCDGFGQCVASGLHDHLSCGRCADSSTWCKGTCTSKIPGVFWAKNHGFSVKKITLDHIHIDTGFIFGQRVWCISISSMNITRSDLQ